MSKIKKEKKDRKQLGAEMWKSRYLYLLIFPALIWIGIFCYGPMYGVIMAFKDFNARLGILGSEWVGLKHFNRFFITADALGAIANTIIISLGRLFFEFPVPIILAILVTEMPGKRLKKIYQTVFTLPHFLSWVVVSTIMINFLGQNGAVNMLLSCFGFEKVGFLGNKNIFRPILYLTSNWKEAGWAAIIYMAAIASIDLELYDAAKVDGASRLRQIWHITLPGIKVTISVMFILQVAYMMNAGFDQIFNLRNAVVKPVSQILDTYVYDITFQSTPNYGFSTAVGLFTSGANFVLLVIANRVVYKLTGEKMFG